MNYKEEIQKIKDLWIEDIINSDKTKEEKIKELTNNKLYPILTDDDEVLFIQYIKEIESIDGDGYSLNWDELLSGSPYNRNEIVTYYSLLEWYRPVKGTQVKLGQDPYIIYKSYKDIVDYIYDYILKHKRIGFINTW